MTAYVAPLDWTTSERVLSTKLNSEIRDHLLFEKSRPFGNVTMSAVVNTTSTTFTELVESRITLTTYGGNVLIQVCGIFSNNTAGVLSSFDVALDGVRYGDATVGLTQINTPGAGYGDCLSFDFLTSTPPSAGSHLYSIYWKTASNTASILTRFQVIEIQ